MVTVPDIVVALISVGVVYGGYGVLVQLEKGGGKSGEWVIVGNLCVLLAGTVGTDLDCWRRGMSL